MQSITSDIKQETSAKTLVPSHTSNLTVPYDDFFSVIFVVATPFDSNSFKNTAFFKSYQPLYVLSNIVSWQQNIKFTTSLEVEYSNHSGLCKVYNEKINSLLSAYKNNEMGKGCFVFVHDDVSIEDLFFFSKLAYYHNKYDVIGVAGSKVINFDASPMAWHISPRDSWRGNVIHPIKNSEEYYNNSYGPTPSTVATIDGLFMSVRFDTIYENNLLFDEDFTFDFYDMSFCARALLSDLNIGVIPLHLVHNSHGGGIKKLRYGNQSKLFTQKYKTVLLNKFNERK